MLQSSDPFAWEEWEQRDEEYITCRRCGTGWLRWGKHEGSWRLFDDDELHVCPAATVEEFPCL